MVFASTQGAKSSARSSATSAPASPTSTLPLDWLPDLVLSLSTISNYEREIEREIQECQVRERLAPLEVKRAKEAKRAIAKLNNDVV